MLVRDAAVNALCAILPERYPSAAQASKALDDIQAGLQMGPSILADELVAWVESQRESSSEKTPHLVYIIDEMGQFIGDSNDKLLELQSIAEAFASKGLGKLWLVVTAQEALEEIVVAFGFSSALPIVKDYIKIAHEEMNKNPKECIEYMFPVDEILKIHRFFCYLVTYPYPGELSLGKNPWTMNIFLGDRKERTLEGIINIDPDTMGIDLLGVLEVHDIDEFLVTDGEIVNGRPLDRTIYLVHEKDVDKLRVGSAVRARTFKGRVEREEVERSFNITPVTMSILEEL